MTAERIMNNSKNRKQGGLHFNYLLRLLFLSLSFGVSFDALHANDMMTQEIIAVHSRFSINSTTFSGSRFTVDEGLTPRSLVTLQNIDSIVVTGSASPEGSKSWNLKMAKRRSISLGNSLKRRMKVSSNHIAYRTEVSNWQGLLSLVENSYDMPKRGIFEYNLRKFVMKRLSGDKISDLQITQRLRRCAGRGAWNYVARKLLPKMRSADAVIYCSKATNAIACFGSYSDGTVKRSSIGTICSNVDKVANSDTSVTSTSGDSIAFSNALPVQTGVVAMSPIAAKMPFSEAQSLSYDNNGHRSQVPGHRAQLSNFASSGTLPFPSMSHCV